MQDSKTIIEDYSNSNGRKDLKANSNRTIAIGLLSKEQEDKILDQLVSEEVIHPDYKLFFVKYLRRLGPVTFLNYANQALTYGRTPSKYFTSLCKRSDGTQS